MDTRVEITLMRGALIVKGVTTFFFTSPTYHLSLKIYFIFLSQLASQDFNTFKHDKIHHYALKLVINLDEIPSMRKVDRVIRKLYKWIHRQQMKIYIKNYKCVDVIKTYWLDTLTNGGVCIEFPLEKPSKELILKIYTSKKLCYSNKELHA